MGRNRMQALLAIRQQAVEQAIRALAACLSVEADAAAAIHAVDAAVPRERAEADGHPDTPRGHEVYAAWSAQARARRSAAVAALAQAEQRTAQARAGLADARAAARAVGDLIELYARQAREAAERKEAHALDDMARARRRDRPDSGTAP